MAIENYLVETTLTLQDRLTPALRNINSALLKTDERVAALQGKLDRLRLPATFVSGLTEASNAARGLGRAMETIRTPPAAAGMGRFAIAIERAERNAQQLQRTLSQTHMPAMAFGGGGRGGFGFLPPIPPTGPHSRVPGEGEGRGGGGIFTGRGRNLLFDTWLVGSLAHRAVSHMVGPSAEFEHQRATMGLTSMTDEQRAAAERVSWATTRTAPTTTPARNLASIQELRMVFGGTPQAFTETLANLPTIQKLSGILGAYGGGTSGKDMAYEVSKALELKGAVKDPAQFTEEANMMAKAIGASGGKVTPTDFLQTFKYGRGATLGWDQDFTYTILPTLIQEMKSRGGTGGAGGPGNALMSAYAEVVGGVISQRALGVWEKLGLVDPTKEVFNKVGTLKGIKPGGILGWETFMKDPFKFSQNYITPAFDRAGLNDEQRRQYLQYMFPNRTAGFLMGQMVTQPWKFERDVPLIRGQAGIEGYDKLMREDPQMAWKAFGASWETLRTALVDTKAAIPLLNTLSDAMGGLATSIVAHPETAGQVERVAGSLGILGGGILALGATTNAITWSSRGLVSLASGASALAGVAGLAGLGGTIAAVAGGLSALALVGAAAAAGARKGIVLSEWGPSVDLGPNGPKPEGLSEWGTVGDWWKGTAGGYGVGGGARPFRARSIPGRPEIIGSPVTGGVPGSIFNTGGYVDSAGRLVLGGGDWRADLNPTSLVGIPEDDEFAPSSGRRRRYRRTPFDIGEAFQRRRAAGDYGLGLPQFDLPALDNLTPPPFRGMAITPGAGQNAGDQASTFGTQFGQAAIGVLQGAGLSLAASMTGETTLTGDLHLHIPGFEDLIDRLVAKGIMHGSTGNYTDSSRPDYRGGLLTPGS